ncbi:hypothetical protein AZH43_14205 [Acinetobacter pragensis]|uniref:Uncharacterized protein n=1 Tax=Acinetobacter pragensis TaxID=1806892 RepID=A0A151Y0D0_9GAMM|nr:hypothetical protein AZH43_14205 [Acinetobacter pragensis]
MPLPMTAISNLLFRVSNFYKIMTHAGKKQVIKNYQITLFSAADTKTHKSSYLHLLTHFNLCNKFKINQEIN